MCADSSHKPGGLILAMAGSEERLQLVLGEPGPEAPRLLASREWTVPGESVRFLVPGLKETLDGFGLDMQAIDRIACVRGPGSFTGLRLVLAAAQGLAAGCGARLGGIDYLPLLATGPASVTGGILHVLTHARRGLVYLQSFNLPSLREARPLASLSLAEAVEAMDAISDQALLLGSALRKNSDFFSELTAQRPGYTLLAPRWDNPSPQALLEAALQAEYGDGPIEPVYVRATDAEDNLPHIARKRGIDPDKARQRLDELTKA